MIMAEAVIDVVELAKSYDGRVIVQNVSLRVMLGDIVGLVGANGGGKTTTLQMIAGLLRPDRGQGSVLGQDVGDAKRDCRAKIGYMSQRVTLYADLTVAENLRFRAAVYGIESSEARIADIASLYGINDVLTTRVGKLSGGWARRVQFAATVLHAPPLLLLDEPTAGLDVATKHNIWSWINMLAATGHAIVVATHDLVEAERLPSILLYRDGNAMAATTPEAFVLASGCGTLEAAVIAHDR